MSTYDQMRYELLLARRLPADRRSLPEGFASLGDRAGLWPRTVRRYEIGEHVPIVADFHKWATALGYEPVLRGPSGEAVGGGPGRLIAYLILARELRGETQAGVAKLIDFGRPTVAAWERRERQPAMPDFITWAATFDLAVEIVKREAS